MPHRRYPRIGSRRSPVIIHRPPALILPANINRSNLRPPPFFFNGIARLRDGVTLEQASADIERMLPIWIERFPFPGGASGRQVYLDTWRVGPALRPFKDDVESLIALGNEAESWRWQLCNLRSVLESKHDMRKVRPL